MHQSHHCRPYRAALCLLALVALCALAALLAGCGPKLRTSAPPGAAATLTVDPLVNGTTDTAAQLARRVIWTYVPPAWLPASEHVILRSAEPAEIAAVIRADRYTSEGFSGTFTGDGFTSISGNDTRNPGPDAPTIIYLSKGIWGQSNVIGEVALHEYAGHVRYWHGLTDAQRSAWTPLWADAVKRGALPTAYAATNEYEGFAECMAYALVGKLKDATLRGWFQGLGR